MKDIDNVQSIIYEQIKEARKMVNDIDIDDLDEFEKNVQMKKIEIDLDALTNKMLLDIILDEIEKRKV